MCFCSAKTRPVACRSGQREPLWTPPEGPETRRAACMGRPRKSPEERRQNGPNPRMTTAERAEVERNAAILGVSPSDFVRRRSLSYRLPAALAVQRHLAALAVALLRL